VPRVVVFRAPARRPRGAVVLPVVAALCSFPRSFATVLLRLRRFLRESRRVLSRSLTRSRPPRPSSLRRSLSAPSAASIDLSRRSSARGPRVVVLELDVLLARVLLLPAVERLAWAILGLPLLAYPAAAKPTSKRGPISTPAQRNRLSAAPRCYPHPGRFDDLGGICAIATGTLLAGDFALRRQAAVEAGHQGHLATLAAPCRRGLFFRAVTNCSLIRLRPRSQRAFARCSLKGSVLKGALSTSFLVLGDLTCS
jgi:hypothetical protein